MSAAKTLEALDDTDAPASDNDDSTVKGDFTPCGRCDHPRYTHLRRCTEVGCHCGQWRRSRPRDRGQETIRYLGAARRFIRAAGHQVGGCDEHELAALLSLQGELDAALQTAVDGQRRNGKSWAAIARGTGTTREAAYQRWGKK